MFSCGNPDASVGDFDKVSSSREDIIVFGRPSLTAHDGKPETSECFKADHRASGQQSHTIQGYQFPPGVVLLITK